LGTLRRTSELAIGWHGMRAAESTAQQRHGASSFYIVRLLCCGHSEQGLYIIALSFHSTLTPHQDLAIGRSVAPVTNVSVLMQKDASSGKMSPIDPKSPLANELASVTMSRAEAPSDVVKLMNMEKSSVDSSSSSSSINLGAAIGVPVSLFFLVLFLFFFYRRNPFLYTRHRDALSFAGRWAVALVTCKLGSIQQESSIVRPKSRSSFTRLEENDLPHSDSDSSDAEVLHPPPLSSVSAPAPASSPARSLSAAKEANADEASRPKPKTNIPDVVRQSRLVSSSMY
jgi:hypothetical protein